MSLWTKIDGLRGIKLKANIYKDKGNKMSEDKTNGEINSLTEGNTIIDKIKDIASELPEALKDESNLKAIAAVGVGAVIGYFAKKWQDKK